MEELKVAHQKIKYNYLRQCFYEDFDIDLRFWRLLIRPYIQAAHDNNV